MIERSEGASGVRYKPSSKMPLIFSLSMQGIGPIVVIIINNQLVGGN